MPLQHVAEPPPDPADPGHLVLPVLLVEAVEQVVRYAEPLQCEQLLLGWVADPNSDLRIVDLLLRLGGTMALARAARAAARRVSTRRVHNPYHLAVLFVGVARK